MKKGFLKDLKERLVKIQNKNVNDTIETNENQVETNSRQRIDYSQVGNGYVRMTGNGEAIVTKEQIIQETISSIKNFVKLNEKVISPCQITDDEWMIFLEVAYNYFDEFLLNGGFNCLMMTGIKYVMFNGFVNNDEEITLQKLLENFEIPMLPYWVADGMIDAIKKDVYIATRKDNMVDLLEYKKLTENGRHK